MRISIIVPVFNVEKYLDRCLNSILKQGFDWKEVELILVNDGSTDDSLSICEKFAEDNENCRIISQENRGLSGARNTGLEYARGDYICFVDADDDLKDGGISQLLGFCDNSVDIIRYYSEIFPPGKDVADQMGNYGDVLFEGFGNEYIIRYGLDTFCWNFLYRRQFLLDHNRTFENVINEDLRFISSVLLDNPKMVSTTYPIYNYRIRENSISTTRTQEHFRRWSYDLLETLMLLNARLEEKREKNPRLYDRGLAALQRLVPMLFSRVLSSDLTKEEEVALVEQCRASGLLPLPTDEGTVMTRFSRKTVNILACRPWLYPFARELFCRVFLPFIKPFLNRNL